MTPSILEQFQEVGLGPEEPYQEGDITYHEAMQALGVRKETAYEAMERLYATGRYRYVRIRHPVYHRVIKALRLIGSNNSHVRNGKRGKRK